MLAVLLVAVPIVAALVNLGRWEPQGDDALIELRARDVGTSRTPLVGQPSTSGAYGESTEHVAHPGPAGFVVLAPGIRLLGPVAGSLLSASLVNAAAMLTVVWLLFRHLGPRGGAAGAVLVALAAFSAGAGGLVDPLSSNFGRLPLLAAAVGVWGLLCGDLRVAPLTVVLWSFAAQQHLSVLPAAAVLAGVGLLGATGWAIVAIRDDRATWRPSLICIGGAVVAGLLVWSPVLWQEVRDDPGNLSLLADYSGDEARDDLGLRSATAQVATALGPRPLLGRSSPQGWDLVAGRSAVGVALTFAVVGGVLAAGGWWQRRDRRFVAAAAMVGVLVVAGLVTGTNIPDSPEQGRINFFHWAFALSFFWLLVLGWLGARLAPVVTPQLTHGRVVTSVVAAGVVVGTVAVVPVVADRRSDRLVQPIETGVVRSLLAEARASGVLDEIDRPTLVVVNGDDRFIQAGDTVGVRLLADGVPVVFPPWSRGYVHPTRIVEPCAVDQAVVVSLLLGEVEAPPGVELARVDASPGLDREALARLEAQAEGVSVDFGPDLQAALDALPGRQGSLVGSTIALRLPSQAQRVLLVRSSLDLLIDHPPASPRLAVDDLVALRDSLPDGQATVVATEVALHLLDAEAWAAWQPESRAACG